MQQNYSDHGRYVKGFHFVLSAMILTVLIASIVHFVCLLCSCHGGNCASGSGCSSGGDCCLFRGVMPLLVSAILVMLWWYTRQFAVKVQDRTIRAEENMRHYIMTGKPLDPRLTMGQIVALRFAGDDEYLALTARAINEQLKSAEIKKAIKSWRADNYRC